MAVADDYFAAARLLAAGDARAAAQRLNALLAAGGLPPAAEADARHLLGRALGVLGDREGMVREWRRVLRLDAVAPRRRPLMSEHEVESVAAAALDELPQDLLDELQGVGIMVVDRPSPEMVDDGLDPRLLGLYHGVPLSRRSRRLRRPLRGHHPPVQCQPGAGVPDARGARAPDPRDGAARDGALLRLLGGPAAAHGAGLSPAWVAMRWSRSAMRGVAAGGLLEDSTRLPLVAPRRQGENRWWCFA